MKRTLILLAGVLALAACSRATPPVGYVACGPLPAVVRDPHSYANTDAFVTCHLDFELGVDFARQELAGSVILDLARRGSGAPELVLDTRDLAITAVESATATGAFRPTTFTLDARDPMLGSALRIAMPEDALRVRVRYTTSPGASGLQWVQPAQTAGKQHPFLYTQAQAIHARSFIPLQDTPAVRATYAATIRTPKELTAVMAAEFDPAAPRDGEWTFTMPQAIPAYLIAFGVGDLEFKSIGARTGIWAEPGVLAAAVAEFADTEAMLEKAEALYGPYRWGRYDLLILPPSFPWGGMENPRLTFATPTVLAGDKSLVALVAHELAHSWSGNLVTNATWSDAWLNEGFTVYFENRIMEAVYGESRAAMERGIGLGDLKDTLAELPQPGDGALTQDYTGRDPDDAFSQVAYEKGALFLRQLEARVGRATLDPFLTKWFEGRAFTSVSTPDFLAYLRSELVAKHPEALDEAFITSWMTSTGIPADAVLPVSDAFDKVDAQRMAWEKGTLATAKLEVAGWTVQEWLHFIDNLSRPLATARMAELDARFGLTESRNSEIAHSWYKLAIISRYAPAEPALAKYLTAIGRRKLIVPLYRELARTPEGLALAKRVYAEASPSYHVIARESIEPLLNPPQG
jgi:leukotriene-A4 hydrolase